MVKERRVVEVETLEEFDRLVGEGARIMRGWQLQDLDLTGRSDVLRSLDARGALVLGGRLEPTVAEDLRRRGALVFPGLPGVPVDVYRAGLYTPEDLYAGLESGYDATLDARAYAWARRETRDLQALLAQSLHDLAVDDALEEFLVGREVVGVMGGHALQRGSDAYAGAALLGRDLARAGFTVATGGGPGAMEAANLGAHLSVNEDDVLTSALRELAGCPSYEESIGAWALAAFDVRRRWREGAATLGVPTWFYGHEPPNAFAGAIAKYFKNAIREDVLLHVCRSGIVFLPGLAGTVQEVFQAACENFYAADHVAPMVLVGTDYWTRELPVWPLLHSLAAGRSMESAVHLVDDVSQVLPRLPRGARTPQL